MSVLSFPGKSSCRFRHVRALNTTGSMQVRVPPPLRRDEWRLIPNGLSGFANTWRYWDCMKPACSYPRQVNVRTPHALTCNIDGVTPLPQESQGYACSNQQPWVANRSNMLSFGFVAFVARAGMQRSCCTCLELKFADPRLRGKTMVVQVINASAGPDFVELAVPGGGVGFYNKCLPQWNAGPEWGKQYGGLGEKNTCWQLPQPLRGGCKCVTR